MEIPVADLSPVYEFDAKFVGAARRFEELILANPKHRVEFCERWDGCLADPYGADRIRFDEFDRSLSVIEKSRQGRSGHPSGSAAPNDDDATYTLCVTVTIVFSH